jgi:two-component system NtrC family sensor kinase
LRGIHSFLKVPFLLPGELRLSIRGDNVKQIVEEILLYLKGIIPHWVKVKVEIPEGITIYADPQHIKQVLINLIKNAVDAIEGEGEIKIKA